MATMPNVIGEEYQEAIQAIIASGVYAPDRWSIFASTTIQISWTPSLIESGTVLAQSPSAGADVAVNSPVMLTVSAYAMSVAYP